MQPLVIELEAQQGEPEFVLAPSAAGLANEAAETQFVSVSPLDFSPPEPRPAAPVEQIISIAQAGKHDRPLTPPVLGAPVQDELPQLERVPLPEARGIATPLIPGYDRGFLLRTGVHPPIFPGLNPVLQQSLAPVSIATDSFDEIRMLAAAKKRILPEKVRTEDFIAAVDHQLPAVAPGEIGLSITGSYSQFGPEGTRLLGLGVRAGDTVRRTTESAHLVIAIDFSAGLGRSGNWPWVREAIMETVGRLGKDDRISLVFYQDEVLMGSSPLRRSDLSLLQQRLIGFTPQGEVDPAVGLEASLDLALAAETPVVTRRIAVLTDGHFELSSQHRKRLQVAARQAQASRVEVDLITVGGARSVAEGAAAMSQALGVNPRDFNARRQLVHGLVKLLHGDEAITATEVKLTVRFAPEAVAAYRLMGHEANTMAQLLTPSQVVELHSGDDTLVLFELLPTPNKVDNVAEAELSWLDSATGERRLVRRRIRSSELSQPWDSQPPSFRAATIAAETAEQLRGSRSALRELKWIRGKNVELTELSGQLRALRSSSGDVSYRSLSSLLDALSALSDHDRRR
jgi:hypothetical protein